MGLLLKFAVFAFAGYVAWTTAKRWLGFASNLTRPPPTQTVERGPVGPGGATNRPRQPVVEETRACPTCGVYISVSSPNCGRAGCPQG
jgi:hypothetical protein